MFECWARKDGTTAGSEYPPIQCGGSMDNSTVPNTGPALQYGILGLSTLDGSLQTLSAPRISGHLQLNSQSYYLVAGSSCFWSCHPFGMPVLEAAECSWLATGLSRVCSMDYYNLYEAGVTQSQVLP